MLDSSSQEQNFILFAQHGWADTYHDIAYLAKALATEQTIVYTPDLGWINTWIKIAPLVDKVEKIALEAIATHPDLPLRIVGHSMGGLIWLEVLNRHPEWLPKVHSLVLVGSPLGGSDLGRLFDPFGWFPLIARDLGTNRRSIAEAIAAQVPTASIVGDLGNNTDGTVPNGCSQFTHANFYRLDGLRHATLKNHLKVATTIQTFWQNPQIAPRQADNASQLIAKLRSLDLTETDFQNFSKAKIVKNYPDRVKLWQWQSPLQITHVFVSISDKYQDKCIYSAYTGWRDRQQLAKYLAQNTQNK